MWKKELLDQIVAADDLHISLLREDAKTYGTPTWIWCVQVKGELFVRAYNGTASRWYQAAAKKRGGRISTIGKTFNVAFELVSGEINNAIDTAYKTKYGTSAYLPPMISSRARAATVKIIPS